MLPGRMGGSANRRQASVAKPAMQRPHAPRFVPTQHVDAIAARAPALRLLDLGLGQGLSRVALPCRLTG
eukprot:1406662-Prymnesium_polylepis.1